LVGTAMQHGVTLGRSLLPQRLAIPAGSMCANCAAAVGAGILPLRVPMTQTTALQSRTSSCSLRSVVSEASCRRKSLCTAICISRARRLVARVSRAAANSLRTAERHSRNSAIRRGWHVTRTQRKHRVQLRD
jgi:hypothetical protein